MNEFRGDPDTVLLAADTALQNVAHAEFVPDLVNAFLGSFVVRRGGSGDDAEPLRLPPPQLRNHLLREAIAEVFLLGVAAEVFEREYRQHDSLCSSALGPIAPRDEVSGAECQSDQECGEFRHKLPQRVFLVTDHHS